MGIAKLEFAGTLNEDEPRFFTASTGDLYVVVAVNVTTQAPYTQASELAARVHGVFVKIHPFVDGNGRTSWLLMNLELMKSGLPPIVLPVEKRLEYYETLDTAHTKNDYEPFLNDHKYSRPSINPQRL